MAIYRLMGEASFGQDDIDRMSAAYEGALRMLHLTDRDDPLTELIAKKIVDLVRCGEHDPPKICARAIKELGIPVGDSAHDGPMDQRQRELTMEQCLEQANLCRILAQRVTPPQHNEMLDQIADIWERIAADIYDRRVGK